MTGTSSNTSSTNSSISKTPELSRHLFTLHEDEPALDTEEEKACSSDSFHTRVARIIHQVIPKYTLENIDDVIRKYLSPMHIVNEGGLSILEESDLPPKDTCSDEHWKNPVFRKTFLTIVKASVEYRLLPSTNFNLLNRWTQSMGQPQHGTPSSISITSGSSSLKDEKYKIDACAKVTLDTYSGLSADYKKWDEHVRYSYGVSGLNEFLIDSVLCTQHPEISRSIKYNLCNALKESHLSYLVDEHPQENNAAKFYEIIKKAADETSDQRIREFKAWWHLFTQILDSPQAYNSFINQYNKSISTLKEASSKGVDDEVLLRALLIRSIQCDEFEDVKKEITKNLDMKPKDILKLLKTHHLALESEKSFEDITSIGGKPKSRAIRRGKTNDTTQKDKRQPFIPSWPQGLYDVCTESLWGQLSVWKSLVNKPNKNSGEYQRLRDFTIHTNDDESSKSSRNSNRDRNDRGYSNRNHDNKRKRSGKSNRYTKDTKRHSRRSSRHDRSSSPDPDSDDSRASTFSENSSRNTKKIRRSARRDDNNSRSPSPLRDRSSSKILGGILNRR